MDTGKNIFLFCDFYVIFLYPSHFLLLKPNPTLLLFPASAAQIQFHIIIQQIMLELGHW